MTAARVWSRRSALRAAMAGAMLGSLPIAANAAPEDEVASVMSEWAKAFSEHNVDRVTALYSKDALLWGTIAPWLRTTPDQVREYFVTAFKIPNITVAFTNQTTRIFGNTAVVAGNYTFTARRDDQTQDSLARYSFTLIKDGNRWLIVDHNSSPMQIPRGPSSRT
jgi:uncharacterized protein (TIGR02246 family)